MDTKLKKSNLFRNIAWIVIIFTVIFSVTLGTKINGEYKIYKDPYSSHEFISALSDIDSNLNKALIMLNDDGIADYDYISEEIQRRKNQISDELEAVLNDIENMSIHADSVEEYERIKEDSIKEAKNKYEEDIENVSNEVNSYVSELVNTIKGYKLNLKNLEFFIMDKESNKVITNVPEITLDEFLDSNNDNNDIEFLIQKGPLNQKDIKITDNAILADERLSQSSNVITIYRSKSSLIEYQNDFLYSLKQQSKDVKENRQNFFIVDGILILLSLLSVYYLYATKDIAKGDFKLLNKIYGVIPVELKIILVGFGLYMANELLFRNYIYYYSFNNKSMIRAISGSIPQVMQRCLFMTVIYVLMYVCVRNAVTGCKTYGIGEYGKKNSLIFIVTSIVKDLYLNVKGRKLVILNCILSIVWIGVAISYFYKGASSEHYFRVKFMMTGTIMLVIYVIAVMAYWFKIDKCMTNIYKASSRIRQGDFHQIIKEEGPATLRLTAENLNNIKDGLEKAINSATRNEQLKTELITNVSHDLKTPLTSIINYIDLLKDENATEEEKKKYIDIITKKSARLKVLIEDLFEASKAASKTMELNMEKADIVSLVRQTLGEFEEKISNSNLKFVVKLPEEKAYVNIDGKRTWRVLENLLSNILKYSMDNTRVYIEVIPTEEDVRIVMRNISAFEMDFNEEDILERFKRGDGSRHTEGSGLGLSIAKSLTELQDGTFKIDIDGDLFKVTVTFKKYIDNINAE